MGISTDLEQAKGITTPHPEQQRQKQAQGRDRWAVLIVQDRGSAPGLDPVESIQNRHCEEIEENHDAVRVKRPFCLFGLPDFSQRLALEVTFHGVEDRELQVPRFSPSLWKYRRMVSTILDSMSVCLPGLISLRPPVAASNFISWLLPSRTRAAEASRAASLIEPADPRRGPCRNHEQIGMRNHFLNSVL